MATKLVKCGFLPTKNTVFFLCDVQEKFRNLTNQFSDMVHSANRLVKTSKILEIPLIVTEQNPKALGNTVPEIDKSHAIGTFPKTKFSMCIPEVVNYLNSQKQVECVVLFGIETHACIEQTAVELTSLGLQVHVVADACTSRSQEDRLLAFERMKQIGCFITTTEAVIFNLLEDKNHPNFNDIRPLVKNVTPYSGLGGVPTTPNSRL